MHRFLEATAGQYMTRTVKTVTRDTTMRELQRMFDEDGFNCYPVREGEDIVGIVSQFRLSEMLCVQSWPHGSSLRRIVIADGGGHHDAGIHLCRSGDEADAGIAVDGGPPDEERPGAGCRTAAGGIIAREDIMRALASCARG